MNKANYLVLFVLLFLGFQLIAQVQVKNLKCEYLVNPLGIDEPNPRFTWQMETNRNGLRQKAYQLVAGTEEAEVASGRGNVWESGSVASGVIPAIYRGSGIQPFTRYYWSVRVQDETGSWSDWAKVAWFESGMMDQRNWKGQWITDTHDYNVKPAPYFRKAFQANKSIQSARAYIAVAGLYELSINGKRIGDHQLDPMYTRFDRRNLYVTYDVTEELQQGENVLGVLLGNGWYNHQSTAVWFFDKAPWRARPKFCMDLRIIYDDGSEEK
jgi:alpha-L-rhamnosidase